MRIVSGFIRTNGSKIWFWISCWEDDPVDLPLAA